MYDSRDLSIRDNWCLGPIDGDIATYGTQGRGSRRNARHSENIPFS